VVNDPGIIFLWHPEYFEHDNFFNPSVRAMLAAPAPVTVAYGLVPRSANDWKFREAVLCRSMTYG
jgi:hypothetical protein